MNIYNFQNCEGMREGQLLRRNIRIDVSKSSFEACYTTMDMEGVVRHKASRKFKNTKAGFEEFLRWSERQQDSQLELLFTMEATGTYHEGLAYFLCVTENRHAET